jgi:hypothetical protein
VTGEPNAMRESKSDRDEKYEGALVFVVFCELCGRVGCVGLFLCL